MLPQTFSPGAVRPKREQGQGLVEYGLILVLVSIASIAMMVLLGDSMNGVYNTIDEALSGQEVNETGEDFTIGGFSPSATGSGMACTVTIPSVTISRYMDGQPAAGAVGISINAGAGTVSRNGTAGADGRVTFSDITLTGACSPGTATITAGTNSRSFNY
jgi:pilus assembly protein Flp/PilA